MKETLKVPLKEYENLRDLFQFLEANGMEQEKKQVMEMTEYIDYVDGKLSELLSELSEVKSQLSNIQNRSLKTAMEAIVGNIEEKAHHLKEQVLSVKNRTIEWAGKTVEECKRKGKGAFSQMLRILHFPEMMETLQKSFHAISEMADHGIDHLGNIGDELHDAKYHLGNIGLEMKGQEIPKKKEREIEKGMLFQIQKSLYWTMGVCKKIEGKTRIIQERVQKWQGGEGRETMSVRERLDALKKSGNEARGKKAVEHSER